MYTHTHDISPGMLTHVDSLIERDGCYRQRVDYCNGTRIPCCTGTKVPILTKKHYAARCEYPHDTSVGEFGWVSLYATGARKVDVSRRPGNAYDDV